MEEMGHVHRGVAMRVAPVYSQPRQRLVTQVCMLCEADLSHASICVSVPSSRLPPAEKSLIITPGRLPLGDGI